MHVSDLLSSKNNTESALLNISSNDLYFLGNTNVVSGFLVAKCLYL